MKTPFTGGCACGAVRYECTAQPDEIQMFACHCRDCQHITGGPYAPVVFIPAKTLRFTRGAVRHHTTPSAAGGLHLRGFCADCGSRLTGGENPGVVSTHLGVTASSLDDPSGFRPAFHIFVADRQPWDILPPDAKTFRHYAPA